jgi:GNAT superfamily N-acetyltransferase
MSLSRPTMSDVEIRELTTDAEFTAAFPVMRELRDRILPETFLSEVRRQQKEHYQLIGAFEDGQIVALAGFRHTHTLSRGEHLFVDDLITSRSAQGRGYATALLRWIARRANELKLAHLYLDSRNTARTYYEKVGFKFSTALPCRIEVAQLL